MTDGDADRYDKLLKILAGLDPEKSKLAADQLLAEIDQIPGPVVDRCLEWFSNGVFSDQHPKREYALSVVANLAAVAPHHFTDEVIYWLYAEMDVHRQRGYTVLTANEIETIHITLLHLLEQRGAAFVEPAIVQLVDHLDDGQRSEWGEEVLLRWLYRRVEPPDLEAIIAEEQEFDS